MKSAAAADDLPRDGTPEIAMVGRSNVGKSSLINALTRQRVARTSAAPGKTRLANIYRVARGASAPLYLVDLPGYGYARGGVGSAREFAELTRAYFVRETRQPDVEALRRPSGGGVRLEPGTPNAGIAALLLVDARHPGLASDLEAWQWLQSVVDRCHVIATKIDKLTRGERIRALRELQSVFVDPVLPVSAETGEGLDELWKLIDKPANTRSPKARNPSSPAPTAPLPLRKSPTARPARRRS